MENPEFYDEEDYYDEDGYEYDGSEDEDDVDEYHYHNHVYDDFFDVFEESNVEDHEMILLRV